MGKRKGIIYEAIERLKAKMALGASRFEQKQVQRQSGEQVWPFSSEQVHSHGTRNAYQQHIMQFIQWAVVTNAIRRLEPLDQRAEELAVAYVTERLEEGCCSS